MSGSPGTGDSMVVITAVGLSPVVRIVDEFAKTLGMTGATITSERGRGRVVAIWTCSSDIALESRNVLARMPYEVSATSEIFVSLHFSELHPAAFAE